MTPAWKTIEFWTALISSILGILTAMGYVSSEKGTALTNGLIQLAGVLLTLVPPTVYVRGRLALKQSIVAALRPTSFMSASAVPTTAADFSRQLLDLGI